MLTYIKNNEEIQKKLNWKKSKLTPATKNEENNNNFEEINDYPPAFNLKLEESNLGNIYHHVDPSFLNSHFFMSLASKVINTLEAFFPFLFLLLFFLFQTIFLLFLSFFKIFLSFAYFFV